MSSDIHDLFEQFHIWELCNELLRILVLLNIFKSSIPYNHSSCSIVESVQLWTWNLQSIKPNQFKNSLFLRFERISLEI